MRIMVVGKGGREHAIVWKLASSPLVDELICAPGNPGIAELATCFDVETMDTDGIVALATTSDIDLVVVGPEDPLAAGLADALREAGFLVAGHSAAATRIESSKAFAKEIMAAAGVPTAAYRAVSTLDDGIAAILEIAGDGPVVVKADGLAAGKGVVVAANADDGIAALERMLRDHAFGDAGDRVVIEQVLEGPEVSVLCVTDGTTIYPLSPSCDYKRAFDGDAGPNTGGMGSYAPTRLMDDATLADVQARILQPVVDELRRRGTPLCGILYAGLAMTADGPQVVEFNARFGDPETQVVLPTLDADLAELLLAAAEGRLGELPAPTWSGAAVCVCVASRGYPDASQSGVEITGLAADLTDGELVFHAGTSAEADGRIVTAGGRVLGLVGRGESIAQARDAAYGLAGRISFGGAWHRTDIAAREA